MKGLEPKNVDFPGPGTYATTRPWEQPDFHQKKAPFNGTASRNDKRSFTHAGNHHVYRSFLLSLKFLLFCSQLVLVDIICYHQLEMKQ
jgi:hypothetical protein